MRIRRRYAIAAQYASPEPSADMFGAVVCKAYGEKTAFRANIAPTVNKVATEMYGERVVRMRQLIMEPGERLTEGDGVWLSGETQQMPAWVCVNVDHWQSHTLVTIEKRGDPNVAGSSPGDGGVVGETGAAGW